LESKLPVKIRRQGFQRYEGSCAGGQEIPWGLNEEKDLVAARVALILKNHKVNAGGLTTPWVKRRGQKKIPKKKGAARILGQIYGEERAQKKRNALPAKVGNIAAGEPDRETQKEEPVIPWGKTLASVLKL